MSLNLSLRLTAPIQWAPLRFLRAGLALLPLGVSGQASWNHAFASEDAEIFGFDAASFFVPGQQGFVMFGTTGDEDSQAVVRFDGSGNESWSALLSASTALPDSVEVSPDLADISQLLATYYTPGDSRVHVGLFKGSDFSPIFARSYPVTDDYERLELNQLAGAGGAITQLLDDGVQVLLLDRSGNTVFARKFTGAPFADLGSADSVSADFQAVSGGYLLMVERSGVGVTDPVTFARAVPRDFTIVRLSPSGGVTGATTMSLTTGTPLSPFWSVLPSGDLLLGVLDFSFNPITNETTNLMRYVLVGSDLSLKWSFQTEGSAFFSFRPDPTGSELYLAGVVYLPDSDESETDAVIARLNLTTGALTTVQTIDRMPYDTAYITEVTADAVYGAIASSNLAAKVETTAFRFSRDLSSATALTYSGPHEQGFVTQDASSGNVLLSVTEGFSTRVVTLSSSLAPSITCPDLNPSTLTLVPGLTTGASALTLTPTAISGADASTASASTSFSLAAFDYTATADGFCVESEEPGGIGEAPVFDLSGPTPKVLFPTEAGGVYLINVSTDLTLFLPLGTVFGDGTVKEYSFTAPTSGGLFIEIVPFSIP